MIGIYKITSPTNKIYIGQSINIEKRKKYYQNAHCKGQKKLYASIIKYGFENHNFEIICECLENELNKLEEYYISYFNSFNTILGMNLDSGGLSKKQSDETKLKRSNSLKGRVFTQEWKDKIAAKSKGRMLGYKHTEETLLKLKNIVKPKWNKPHPKKGTGYSKEEERLRHNESNKRYRLKIKNELIAKKLKYDILIKEFGKSK